MYLLIYCVVRKWTALLTCTGVFDGFDVVTRGLIVASSAIVMAAVGEDC